MNKPEIEAYCLPENSKCAICKQLLLITVCFNWTCWCNGCKWYRTRYG